MSSASLHSCGALMLKTERPPRVSVPLRLVPAAGFVSVLHERDIPPAMAPESCVTVSDHPCGSVDLSGTDTDGIARISVQFERRPALIQWWSDTIRTSLPTAY